MVLVCIHWLTSLVQTLISRKYLLYVVSPSFIYDSPRVYEQEHVAEHRESWVWYRCLHPNNLTVHTKRRESTSGSHLHKAIYQLSVKRHRSAFLQPAVLSFAHKGSLKPLQDAINKQKV